MPEAGMDLRNWECSENQVRDDIKTTDVTKVLGLIWNKTDDTLLCEIPELFVSEQVTKQDMLSYKSTIFDPIEFLSPATVLPKLILQTAWLVRQGWDEELPQEKVSKFKKWQTELQCLQDVSIGRHIRRGLDSAISTELYTFCDVTPVKMHMQL